MPFTNQSHMKHICKPPDGERHILKIYPFIKPVKYIIDIYVCITYPFFLARVAEENNVLDKTHSTTTWQHIKYSSYQNGSYYQENPLLSNEKQRLSFIHNDDFVNLLFRNFCK